MMALNAIDKLDGKASYAIEAIGSFPQKGGVSPHGRYNRYVGRILVKTLQDLDGSSWQQSGNKKKK